VGGGRSRRKRFSGRKGRKGGNSFGGENKFQLGVVAFQGREARSRTRSRTRSRAGWWTDGPASGAELGRPVGRDPTRLRPPGAGARCTLANKAGARPSPASKARAGQTPPNKAGARPSPTSKARAGQTRLTQREIDSTLANRAGARP